MTSRAPRFLSFRPMAFNTMLRKRPSKGRGLSCRSIFCPSKFRPRWSSPSHLPASSWAAFQLNCHYTAPPSRPGYCLGLLALSTSVLAPSRSRAWDLVRGARSLPSVARVSGRGSRRTFRGFGATSPRFHPPASPRGRRSLVRGVALPTNTTYATTGTAAATRLLFFCAPYRDITRCAFSAASRVSFFCHSCGFLGSSKIARNSRNFPGDVGHLFPNYFPLDICPAGGFRGCFPGKGVV